MARRNRPPKNNTASQTNDAGKRENKPRGRGKDENGPVYLYGLHTVKAALANPARTVRHLWATKNAADKLGSLPHGLRIETVDSNDISRRLDKEAVHQGVLAEVAPLDVKVLEDLEEARFILVLDQVTDPHNVGAITRSAVALGADAVLTTARHAPRETGLIAKTASGGLDMIDLVIVPNLAQAIVKLQDMGFVCIGLDSEGPADMKETLYGDKIALVLGAEGQGLRRLTRERCDVLARLDMPGPIKSLNVSNAAVLSMYLAYQHLQQN